MHGHHRVPGKLGYQSQPFSSLLQNKI